MSHYGDDMDDREALCLYDEMEWYACARCGASLCLGYDDHEELADGRIVCETCVDVKDD